MPPFSFRIKIVADRVQFFLRIFEPRHQPGSLIFIPGPDQIRRMFCRARHRRAFNSMATHTPGFDDLFSFTRRLSGSRQRKPCEQTSQENGPVNDSAYCHTTCPENLQSSSPNFCSAPITFTPRYQPRHRLCLLMTVHMSTAHLSAFHAAATHTSTFATPVFTLRPLVPFPFLLPFMLLVIFRLFFF